MLVSVSQHGGVEAHNRIHHFKARISRLLNRSEGSVTTRNRSDFDSHLVGHGTMECGLKLRVSVGSRITICRYSLY